MIDYVLLTARVNKMYSYNYTKIICFTIKVFIKRNHDKYVYMYMSR